MGLHETLARLIYLYLYAQGNQQSRLHQNWDDLGPTDMVRVECTNLADKLLDVIMIGD